MRNNFLIAIAMLLLFVTSCKKDEKLNSTENHVEQSSSPNRAALVAEAYAKLTPEEKNFFNPSYLSSIIISTTSPGPNQEQTHVEERDELDPIVNQVLEKALLLNDGDSFASTIIEDYGYPAWDKAIVSLSIDNSSVNGVHIPFSFIGGEFVNSYLLAMVNPDGEITFAFIDGNFIDGIVGEGNIVFDISYHVTVFIKLNENLFGITPEYLLDWLRLFSENNFNDPEGSAATRCITTEMEICYWVCPYALQDSSQVDTRESCWECFFVTVEQGCDTGGGGVGSGSTSTGGGINTGSGGGGSSSGNDGNNDGTPIFENILEFCGLTGDEVPGEGYELTDIQKKACNALDYLEDNEFPQANINYLMDINQINLIIQIANYIQQGGAYELSLATDYIAMLVEETTSLGFKQFKKLYDSIIEEEEEISNGIHIDHSVSEFLLEMPPVYTDVGQNQSREDDQDPDLETNGTLDGVYQYIQELTDDQLFAEMTDLMEFFSQGELETASLQFIEEFKTNQGSPGLANVVSYVNPIASERVKGSTTLSNFAKNYGKEFNNALKQNNGNPDGINIDMGSKRPVFNSNWHSLKGLRILVNDTEHTTIHMLDDFTVDVNTGEWEGTFIFNISDNFGLDHPDVLSFQSRNDGFAAWYVLQHDRNYVPMRTKFYISYKMSGNFND